MISILSVFVVYLFPFIVSSDPIIIEKSISEIANPYHIAFFFSLILMACLQRRHDKIQKMRMISMYGNYWKALLVDVFLFITIISLLFPEKFFL